MQIGIKTSSFQKLVYEATKLIPKGKITTYKNIAEFIGKPGASQAVGNALRNNPFAPIVPCHRVLPANLKIGGFFGQTSQTSIQVSKKMNILKSEGIIFQGFEVKKDNQYRAQITFKFD